MSRSTISATDYRVRQSFFQDLTKSSKSARAYFSKEIDNVLIVKPKISTIFQSDFVVAAHVDENEIEETF